MSLSNLASIPGSVNSGLAVDLAGNAYTWGLDDYGQLGSSTALGTINPNPTQTGDVSNVIAGASGYKDMLLLDNSGNVGELVIRDTGN